MTGFLMSSRPGGCAVSWLRHGNVRLPRRKKDDKKKLRMAFEKLESV
jgi:hypothetical protein